MLDLGIALEPPQRLGAGRHGEADQRQKRDEERDTEGDQQAAVEKRRHDAPQIEQRKNEKDRDHEEGPQQRLPDALADERKPAQGRRAIRSGGRARCPQASPGTIFLRQTDFASSTEVNAQRAHTRVIWGAMRAKGRPMSAALVSANRAAAPPPACRRSSVLAASLRNGRRRPEPPAPIGGYYTVRRARRHRLRPSSRQ